MNQKNTTLGGKRINEAQNQLRIGVHLYPFVLLTARLPHFFQSMNGSSEWLLCNRGLGRRMAQRGGKKRVIWDLWNRMVQFFVTFLGWWKRDPFKGESWPPRFGDPIGRFESPGEWFNLILPPSMMWKKRPHKAAQHFITRRSHSLRHCRPVMCGPSKSRI